MLVVAGIITFDPSKTELATSAASKMVAATRQEPGNIDYAFSIEMAAPATIRIFEAWETQEALDAHFDTPHMAAFRAEVPEIGVTGMEITRYEVSSSGPMR